MEIRLSLLTVVKDDVLGFKRTMSSIVPQLTSEIEWLIVDGSVDDSIERMLPADIQFQNVRLIRRPPNGIYSAMNDAMANAVGNWCWFINAGDIFVQNYSIDRALELIDCQTTEGIIGTSVMYLTGRGFLFSLVEPQISFRDGLEKCYIHHQGAIFRTTTLREAGGFRTDLLIAADGELMDRLIPQTSVSISREALVGFFMGGASTTNFALALRETNTFRKGFYPRRAFFSLSVKNLGIRMLLKLESSDHLIIFLRPLLARRARKFAGCSRGDFSSPIVQ